MKWVLLDPVGTPGRSKVENGSNVCLPSRSDGIARSYFYDLLRQGRGPKIVKLGRRTMIRGESAAAWRERMEAETTQPAPAAAER